MQCIGREHVTAGGVKLAKVACKVITGYLARDCRCFVQQTCDRWVVAGPIPELLFDLQQTLERLSLCGLCSLT